MKLITFISSSYVDMAHNFYLQLKNFNLHKDFVIYTDNAFTADLLANKNLDCEYKIYKPELGMMDRYLYLLNHNENEIIRAGGGLKYALMNHLKHDIVYQELLKIPEDDIMMLIDTDIIIFDDFTQDIINLIHYPHKTARKYPCSFAIKYYLNANLVANKYRRFDHYLGKKVLMNGGFMGFYNSPINHNFIKHYYNQLCSYELTNIGANSDEIILTNFLETRDINICSIPDSINILSDNGHFYQPGDIEYLKKITKTFHITYAPGSTKVDFLKQSGYWFL